MKISRLHLAAFACVVGLVAATMSRASDTGAAFNDGKSQKSKNPAIKGAITGSDPATLPGYNGSGTSSLKGLYGSDIKTGGATKAVNCETFVPGADEYANQECGTINFVRKNPSVRPPYTIDRKTDPVVINGTVISGAPDSYVGGASMVSGGDSGSCVVSKTSTPAVIDSERCNVGKEVREGYCSHVLKVTYYWASWAGQPTADTTYGYCSGTDIRGDAITLPASNVYSDDAAVCADHGFGPATNVYSDDAAVCADHGFGPATNVYSDNADACSAHGFGTGTGRVYWNTDCDGNKTKVWFDASTCSIPNPPGDVKPAQVVNACTAPLGRVYWNTDCAGNKTKVWFDASTCPVKNAPGDVKPAQVVNACTAPLGRVYWNTDCFGNKTKVWFDASTCPVKNAPGDVQPAKLIEACTNAPRTITNCFTPMGKFTSTTTVPVFVDNLDTASCADLDAGSAVIK